MTDLVDADDAAGPPPSDGLTLIGEAKTFLETWQRTMLGSEDWVPEEISALRQRGRDLDARARAADVGSLAHHLASIEQCFWNGEVDRPKLALCLRNVSEVAWQWRQDLQLRSEMFAHDGHGHVTHERLTVEPPTLLEPPSVEMFESSPPAPEVPSDGFEQALQLWNRPSFFQRLFGAERRSSPGPSAGGSARRDKRPKGAPALPSLADAAYDEAGASEPPPSAEAEAEAQPRLSFAPGSQAEARRGWPRWSLPLGVLGLVGIGVWVWSAGGGRSEVSAGPVLPVAASPARASKSYETGPARTRSPGRDALDRVLAQAHGFGGIESPELADMLDEEAAALARGGGSCVPGAAGCELASTSHPLGAAPSVASAASASATEPRGAWLEGLVLPGIGVKDDPRVREIFEFHTRNGVGREAFQELLFRCGSYRELVHVALDRYGLSRDLLAVPMVASGCVPDVESADGGRGLWQLTPAAATGYRLRVRPQVVDERIDPAKGTDAAVRLLEDLHRKTGSWELAIAAYRIGPLALVARLEGADEEADYWALADAGRLPDEVVKYVPKVQAFALILANLGKFRFEPVPLTPPDVTTALEVPPGTRLGLVARAAASSTTRIRELNPDLLGDRVPDWPGEKFLLRVPKDAAVRAREALPVLIAAANHADECVPHAFDWGRQRFTTAMASRCEHASVLAR